MPVAEKQKKRKKGGNGRAGDGVKYLGVRNGEKWWSARLIWVDPFTGKRKDTAEPFAADSKLLAMQERTKRIQQKIGQSVAERKTFDEVVEAWLDTLESFGTRKGHKNRFGRLPKTWGPKWIDAISTQEIQAYLGNLRRNDGKPFAKGVLNVHRDGLVSLWHWAQWKGYVTRNAARDTLREKTTRTQADARTENEGEKHRALTSEQAVQLILWFQKNEPEMYPLVLCQFMLGCRFGEVTALRLDCVDLRTGMVSIAWSQSNGRVGPTKGKRRRTAALAKLALDVVRAHVERMAALKWPGHDELVFPTQPAALRPSPRKIGSFWSYTPVRLAYRAAFEALGFDMANATHCARHTTSNLASQVAVGAQLSESLVRKVIGTSAQIAPTYRHPEQAEVIQLADVVEKRFFRQQQLQLEAERRQQLEAGPSEVGE